MSKPARYDITLKRGSMFQITYEWRDDAGDLVDLTGYGARMQIRRNAKAELSIDVDSADSEIVMTDEGLITVTISAEKVTHPLSKFKLGRYDLFVFEGDVRTTNPICVVEGFAVYDDNVTETEVPTP